MEASHLVKIKLYFITFNLFFSIFLVILSFNYIDSNLIFVYMSYEFFLKTFFLK